MSNEEQHTMELISTHPSGEQEWYCPICGRHFLLQLPPEYTKKILAPGDESIPHSGATGGIRIQSSSVSQDAEPALPADDRLAVWQEWMDKVDFESKWNAAD